MSKNSWDRLILKRLIFEHLKQNYSGTAELMALSFRKAFLVHLLPFKSSYRPENLLFRIFRTLFWAWTGKNFEYTLLCKNVRIRVLYKSTFMPIQDISTPSCRKMPKCAKSRVRLGFFLSKFYPFFKRFFEPVPVRILGLTFYAKMSASEFSTSSLLCLGSISRLLHAEKSIMAL